MAADTIISRAPDRAFLFAHPAHFIALGFGSGLVRRAPGTVGTLVGWAIYAVLGELLTLTPVMIAFLAIPLFLLGVWACDVTSRHLRRHDDSAIVFDEIVAFLPLAAISSAAWWLQLIAFGLFRLFDIWKPYPIGLVDRNVKGGLGVMLDDLMAAAYAYVAFIVFVVVMHKGFGFA